MDRATGPPGTVTRTGVPKVSNVVGMYSYACTVASDHFKHMVNRSSDLPTPLRDHAKRYERRARSGSGAGSWAGSWARSRAGSRAGLRAGRSRMGLGAGSWAGWDTVVVRTSAVCVAHADPVALSERSCTGSRRRQRSRGCVGVQSQRTTEPRAAASPFSVDVSPRRAGTQAASGRESRRRHHAADEAVRRRQ